MLDRAQLLAAVQGASVHAQSQEKLEHGELERLWRLLGRERIGDMQHSIERETAPYTVIATDGSQIYPDRHAGTAWYVINISTVQLQYGVTESSVHYTTKPSVFAATGELSPGAINAQRTTMELQAGIAALQKHSNALFLVDGPLTADFMEPVEQQSYYKKLAECAPAGMFIAGYTSVPQSKDLITVLSHDFKQMTDTDLVQLFLLPGHFTEPRRITHEGISPHMPLYFLYCHNGYEIIRIEIPGYLLPQVSHIMGIVLDQGIKGMGYPVCLAEAHAQAVIQEADRLYFYQLLAQQSAYGRKPLTQSYKSMKKRRLAV